MTKTEQKRFLRTFMRQMTKDLLNRADRWPEQWDGHELRELAIAAFTHERTALMRENKRRRKRFENDCIIENLY